MTLVVNCTAFVCFCLAGIADLVMQVLGAPDAALDMCAPMSACVGVQVGALVCGMRHGGGSDGE